MPIEFKKNKILKTFGVIVISTILLTTYQNCSKGFKSQNGIPSVSQASNLLIASSQAEFSSSVSASHRRVIESTFSGSGANANSGSNFSRQSFFDFAPTVYLAPVEITADSFQSMLQKLDQVEFESADKRLNVNSLNFITMGMTLTPRGIKAMETAESTGCAQNNCGGN